MPVHLIPVDQAVRLVAQIQREYGLSLAGVARAAGLSTWTLWKIDPRRRRYVEAKTMRALRRLPYLAEQHPQFVPATATILRLQAFAVLGWGQKQVRGAAGCEINPYRSERVTFELAARVAAALKAHAHERGPSDRASKVAINHGWLGPDAYDQELLYDPLWDGRDGVLDYGMSDELAKEEYWFLRGGGVDPEDAARRVGRGAEWAAEEERRAARRAQKRRERARARARARRAVEDANRTTLRTG